MKPPWPRSVGGVGTSARDNKSVSAPWPPSVWQQRPRAARGRSGLPAVIAHAPRPRRGRRAIAPDRAGCRGRRRRDRARGRYRASAAARRARRRAAAVGVEPLHQRQPLDDRRLVGQRRRQVLGQLPRARAGDATIDGRQQAPRASAALRFEHFEARARRRVHRQPRRAVLRHRRQQQGGSLPRPAWSR